jgi:hypothetical protein
MHSSSFHHVCYLNPKFNFIQIEKLLCYTVPNHQTLNMHQGCIPDSSIRQASCSVHFATARDTLVPTEFTTLSPCQDCIQLPHSKVAILNGLLCFLQNPSRHINCILSKAWTVKYLTAEKWYTTGAEYDSGRDLLENICVFARSFWEKPRNSCNNT